MEDNNINYLFKLKKIQHRSTVNTDDISAMQKTSKEIL